MNIDFNRDEIGLLYEVLADKLNQIDFNPETTLDPIAIFLNDVASRLATILIENGEF